MGSGQSARRLTISNEEEVGVIKVSNAVVQRLAQGETTTVNVSSSSARPDTANQNSTVCGTATFAPQDGTATHPMYYPELTMSALRIQKQKEEELKQQEQYWQRRLQNLKDSYQKIERTLEEEYKKAASKTVTQDGELKYCY